jgi:predicted phage-related endonuclease
MADPLSVRHVMATTEIADRITKTEAATNQHLSEDFKNQLQRQEELKQSQVNENEDAKDVKNDEKEKQRQDKEKERQSKKANDPNEDTGEVAAAPSDHIIDLQV